MARKTSLTSLESISEINLTPLMDLTFILLITFIITFPLIEQGVPVDLPQGGGQDLAPDEAMSVSLDQEGQLFLDDRAITMEALEVEMQQVARVKPDMAVMVRADRTLQYAEVIKIMQLLQRAQISRMALVTQSGESIGDK